MKKHDFRIIVYVLFMALFAVSIIFNVVLFGMSEADYAFDGKSVYSWSDNWGVSYGDVRDSITNLPASFDVETGRNVILKKTLPQTIKKYNCLLLESHRQDVQVLVDGVSRAAYSDRDTRLIGDSSPSAFVIVPLYSSDGGKDVTFRIVSTTSYSGEIGEIYLGNEMSIMLNMLQRNAVWIIISFLLFVIAIVCIANYFAYKKNFEESNHYALLFWIALFSAIFCLTQAKLRQLFFSNISIVENFGCNCFLLLPIPIILLYDRFFEENHKAVRSFLLGLSVLNFIAQYVLQFVMGISFFEMQMFSLIVVLIITVAGMAFYIFDYVNKKIYRNIWILISLIVLCVSTIAEIIGIVSHYIIQLGSILTIGTAIFLVINYIDTSNKVSIKQKQKQDAERANAAKSQFLATMSHEIRTPINTVLGMNEMILRDTKDSVVLGYAQNIDSAGHMLLGLVNDILDFSKIESGKLELFPAEYSTKALFYDLYNLIEKRARSKGLELELKIDSDIPSSLEGDMSRIKQILVNILTNAVKYTEKGKVTLSASFMQGEEMPELCVKVADTGQGIREEDIDKLFSRFTRVNEAKNKSIEGTGLGLAITKQLTLMMKGDIKVESIWGEGSTFTVTIPQKVIDNTPIGEFKLDDSGNNAVDVKKKQISFVYPEGKVLIVDDNKVNLIVASGLLKPTQLQIMTATSGDEAIALCKENKYDLIFMDHMMPVKDGIETLHELKDIFGDKWNTPVVVLTANAIDGMKEMYLKEGFDDYLTKPMTAIQLEEILVKYIKSND